MKMGRLLEDNPSGTTCEKSGSKLYKEEPLIMALLKPSGLIKNNTFLINA